MSSPPAHRSLTDAIRRHMAGKSLEAESICREILSATPNHADAIYLLSVIATQAGRFEQAIDLLRQAIAASPRNPVFHNDLAYLLQKQGQLDDAVDAYQQAIKLKPDWAECHSGLGAAWTLKGELDQAIVCYQLALDLKPDLVDAHVNLGAAWLGKGERDKAIACFHRALALRPDSVEAHCNLGLTWFDMGRLDDAIACYQRAIALQPQCEAAYCHLGNVWLEKRQFDRAIEYYRRALAINTIFTEAHSNLGTALAFIGRLDEAIACHRRAKALNPDAVAAHDNLLYALLYHPNPDPRSVYRDSQQWNSQHAEPLKPLIQVHSNDRDPERPLRIGYVSPDFRFHPVGRFIEALLASHDHADFQVLCYSQTLANDHITERLKSHADTWRSTFGLSNNQVADMIRQDRIDFLVDLAGHTANNRLLVFAQKPAPVQVTYLGYPATTGSTTIDYRLTDALADPPGLSDTVCSEHLFRLPQSGWCFHSPDHAPPVSELPATRNGCVTFGSFNDLAKVNPSLLNQWATILRSVPRSRLVVKAIGLTSPAAQQTIRQVMSDSGIEPDRVDLLAWVAPAEHLAQYHRIDIALDTYPYHGTTTTCESLWMGVPVITLAGQSHVSRVGVSLLTNIGLPELIAQTPEKYIQIAADLAADVARLAALRSTLRDRMRNSVLLDADRFARNIEAAYRTMWRTWCAS